MDRLHQKIRKAIEQDRIVYSLHADNQLASRNVERWQAVEGFAGGVLIRSQPAAKPNPKILVRQALPDGSQVVAVWAYVRSIARAKLVTLFFEES